MTSIILQTATRMLLPLMILYSVFLLLQGHHHPGGGFIGGLIAAAAIGLCGLAFDVPTARRILRMSPHRLIGVGLLIALLSGAAGMIGGRPLLTAQWATLEWPGGEELEIGTPLLFDVGVYLVVVGMTSLIVLTLAEE